MSAYKNLLVYYFSGTGNALTAARWMIERAAGTGVSARLFPIVRAGEIEYPRGGGDTLVGFCYPTHGFSTPWTMLKFLIRFPRAAGAHAFLLNTRAGFMVGPLFAPGVSGIAQYLPMLILRIKGYRVRGLLPLDMPQSWIAVCPPIGKKSIGRVAERCQSMVEGFADRLLAGKRSYRSIIWYWLPIDIALLPISAAYFIQGRFFLAKTLFASYRCNSCGLCADNCPVNAIRMIDKRPYWTIHCESCMRCMDLCPQKAIQSLFTRLALFFWFIIVAGTEWLPLNSYLVFFVIAPLAYYPVYWAHFWLVRFKPVNALFTFTSLTRYWGRYLAPGIRIADFRAEVKREGKEKN
jgi:ferredoxin